MAGEWSWQPAGSDTVGVHTYSIESDEGTRYSYFVEIRRAGKEPQRFVARHDEEPFLTREDALAAGRKEGERQYFRLPERD